MSGLLADSESGEADLVTPGGLVGVEGLSLGLVSATSKLAVVPASVVAGLPGSVGLWVLASKLALELIARERVVPTISQIDGRVEARWAAALGSSDDAARVSALSRSMPPSAHAIPVNEEGDVWAPDALLRAFLDAVVDAWVRVEKGSPQHSATAHRPWEQRWRDALTGPQSGFEAVGFAERSVVEELRRWSEAALGARDRLRACFRLELPGDDFGSFTLRFLLQSPDDPSLVVTAAEAWAVSGRSLEVLGRAFRDPQDSLLEALGRAARLYPPIQASLSEAKPERLLLDPATAWTFMGEGAPLLSAAGFGVLVPAELTSAGQRRLRLRMRVGSQSKGVAGTVTGGSGLNMGALLEVSWEAIVGDDAISPAELAALARLKQPLVQFRGAWIAVDPNELSEIQRRMSEPARITMNEAVRAALAGEVRRGGLSMAVAATGDFAELLERVRGGAATEITTPLALRASLRTYQQRGLAWLSTMGSLGLGACLADDMGLGKTVQLIAFLLRRLEKEPGDARPSLLVAPTSVVGNWERELDRFAPDLEVTRHYGAERRRDARELPKKPGSIVLTTYGLLRRDAELLSGVSWAAVVLDEAQNIKNAASTTAASARRLLASHRFALTGTPVENRLSELWSILEFANPGLLGPLEAFRREFAVPVERYGDEQAAERLRRIVSPFLLRRLKSDPNIISDLPAKNEMKVICTLTREQVTLYKAVVDEEMRQIEEAEGIARRGRVLALLMALKQVCNHPAQYLSELGPLASRSGKLDRLAEMLEEALSVGDRALVFTQFKEMGTLLSSHLSSLLQTETMFLHGGTAKKARDEMVRRFQEDPRGPRIFILSVKAGGTGLNLTAASHVFHFDRWWNPAVEDQATDRAYRIGQKRSVQVHKLVCAGTVEDKVDKMLEQKRRLAKSVVGAGEKWITELGNSELRELIALSEDAVMGGDEEEAAPMKKRRARAEASR